MKQYHDRKYFAMIGEPVKLWDEIAKLNISTIMQLSKMMAGKVNDQTFVDFLVLYAVGRKGDAMEHIVRMAEETMLEIYEDAQAIRAPEE